MPFFAIDYATVLGGLVLETLPLLCNAPGQLLPWSLFEVLSGTGCRNEWGDKGGKNLWMCVSAGYSGYCVGFDHPQCIEAATLSTVTPNFMWSLSKHWRTLSWTGSVVYVLCSRYLEWNSWGLVLSSECPCIVGQKQKERESPIARTGICKQTHLSPAALLSGYTFNIPS